MGVTHQGEGHGGKGIFFLTNNARFLGVRTYNIWDSTIVETRGGHLFFTCVGVVVAPQGTLRDGRFQPLQRFGPICSRVHGQDYFYTTFFTYGDVIFAFFQHFIFSRVFVVVWYGVAFFNGGHAPLKVNWGIHHVGGSNTFVTSIFVKGARTTKVVVFGGVGNYLRVNGTI